jgi:hypothetical protein
MADLAKENEFTDDIKAKVEEALAKFKEEFVY